MKPIKMRDLSKRAAQQWSAIAQGAPELLDDLDIQRIRKPRAKPAQREKTLVQRPLVVRLRKHLPRGSVVHAQAIQPLNTNHKFAMQRDGVQFGMPDIDIYVPRDGGFWHGKIECKDPEGGVLSNTQIHTQQLLMDMGVPVLRACHSVDEGVAWLRAQGVEI